MMHMTNPGFETVHRSPFCGIAPVTSSFGATAPTAGWPPPGRTLPGGRSRPHMHGQAPAARRCPSGLPSVRTLCAASAPPSP